MCPPTAFHVDALDPNIKKLLIDVVNRRDFGLGASPGGRAIYIQLAVRDGLIRREGFFPKTGQPRWIITPCGRRVARFLQQRALQADTSLIDLDYNSGVCPAEELPRIDYHDYEGWQENPDSELRVAERAYQETPNWETWDRYNRLLKRAGMPEIPIPTEKDSIQVTPGFTLRATLGEGKPAGQRRNPSKQKKLRAWELVKIRTQPKIIGWIQERIYEQRPISYRFLSHLAVDYAKRYKVPQQWAIDHLFECGIQDILLGGPTDIGNYPARDSWLRPTADWMWQRRDLRKPFE